MAETNSLAQGQVWLADLPSPINTRPVVILTRSDVLSRMRNVTVATITTNIRGLDTEVEILTSDGVRQRCAVSLDNILTLPQHYLVHFIAQLNTQKMNEIFEAIHVAFDLPY